MKKKEDRPLEIIETTREYLLFCENNDISTPPEKLQVTRLITAAIERQLDHKAKQEITFMRTRIIENLELDDKAFS